MIFVSQNNVIGLQIVFRLALFKEISCPAEIRLPLIEFKWFIYKEMKSALFSWVKTKIRLNLDQVWGKINVFAVIKIAADVNALHLSLSLSPLS